MLLQRLPGSFCGLHLRQLGAVMIFMLCSLTLYRWLDNLNSKVALLEFAWVKLEKAVTKLQIDGSGISRPRSSFTDDSNQSWSTERDNDMVLLYNRVPKTGSTSFAGIAYDLCTANRFHVIHMNISRNLRVLGLSDQMRFIKNITGWEEKKPALYHGHVAFIDFSRFGVSRVPIYINMVREPLDRLISYYYFVRYGDDFRPTLRRRKAGDNESFDECVTRGGKDCDPENLWVQVPYFCGHHADCWEPGNQWALEEAKRNLLHHYLLVGITEELRDFLAVLEATLPRFFRGATQLYAEGRKSHLRKTAKKIPPKQETIDRIQSSQIWKMEKEFYEFAKEHFHYVKNQMFDTINGALVAKDGRFMFEKMRPK
ncbi:heparan sulfate 2-O-sulfotransferase 1-like isoform X2 [Physella acuta]|uniref:heparan sulfate 2-O-sulfotransferase 1-like isoform X2 n=1 Tax=Physella acuta TaxID=109671 RepID=UPI0027DE60F1|nr:heparan sulfate 2-O-sulfotransferase 1-like isoform X2 [Physella acuta]